MAPSAAATSALTAGHTSTTAAAIAGSGATAVEVHTSSLRMVSAFQLSARGDDSTTVVFEVATGVGDARASTARVICGAHALPAKTLFPPPPGPPKRWRL